MDEHDDQETAEAAQPSGTGPTGLVLLTLGAIAAVFGLFEVIERTLLRDADVRYVNALHVLRGVTSSIVVALLIARSLLRSVPPIPVRPPRLEEDSARLQAVERDRDRLVFCTRWFVQLRWIAVVVALLLVFLSVVVAELLPAHVLWPLLGTLAALVLFNLGVSWSLRRGLVEPGLLRLQVYVDLVALNLLLHFSGGVENPLYILALFHVIIAGILLTRAQTHRVVAAASGLMALVAAAEWSGVLPHYTLGIVPHGEHGELHLSHDATYVVCVVGIFSGALFLTGYFVTRLSEQLRRDERELERLALRALGERRLLERALETTATGVRVLDRGRRLRWANRQWVDWFGSAAETPDDGEPPAVALTLEDGEVRSREVRCEANGSARWFRLVTAPIREPGGGIREVVEMASETTQQRLEHERMVRASQLAAVGELASHVAHEVNNPISIMSAKARLLLSNFQDRLPDKVRSDLGKIVDLADRVAHIAQGLLSYSRPSHGVRRVIDVTEAVTGAVDLVKQRTANAAIKIVTRLPSDLPFVLGNAQELSQVFLNLMLNAIAAMPEGGTLTVLARGVPPSGTERVPWVEVDVVDTGVGIPEDLRERVFEPFFSTRTDRGGTGLGLSICHGIVTSHGGEIGLESEVGRGTKFTVRLPGVQREP